MVISLIYGVEKTGYPLFICKRTQLDPYTVNKINSKWVRNFKVRPETVKYVEGNIGEKLHEIDLGNDFVGKSTGSEIKDKWDYIKLRGFCRAKETTG